VVVVVVVVVVVTVVAVGVIVVVVVVAVVAVVVAVVGMVVVGVVVVVVVGRRDGVPHKRGQAASQRSRRRPAGRPAAPGGNQTAAMRRAESGWSRVASTIACPKACWALSGPAGAGRRRRAWWARDAA